MYTYIVHVPIEVSSNTYSPHTQNGLSKWMLNIYCFIVLRNSSIPTIEKQETVSQSVQRCVRRTRTEATVANSRIRIEMKSQSNKMKIIWSIAFTRIFKITMWTKQRVHCTVRLICRLFIVCSVYVCEQWTAIWTDTIQWSISAFEFLYHSSHT